VMNVFNNILLEFLKKHKDTEEFQVHNEHVVSCYECEFFILFLSKFLIFLFFFIKIFNLLGVFHAAPEHGRLP
jgi:hypothetical protein